MRTGILIFLICGVLGMFIGLMVRRPAGLTRDEIIAAVEQCHKAKLKTHFLHDSSEHVIEIHCEPYSNDGKVSK